MVFQLTNTHAVGHCFMLQNTGATHGRNLLLEHHAMTLIATQDLLNKGIHLIQDIVIDLFSSQQLPAKHHVFVSTKRGVERVERRHQRHTPVPTRAFKGHSLERIERVVEHLLSPRRNIQSFVLIGLEELKPVQLNLFP